MRLEEIIHRFADENHIIAGICNAEPLKNRENSGLENIPFSQSSLAERITPRLSLPSAQSMIVIGAGCDKIFDFPIDGEKRGRLSISAIGEDYHITVRNILEKLRGTLSEYAEFESHIQVDTGALAEREFAIQSGIASRGRNMNVISERFGSFFNIGLLLVSMPLQPEKLAADDFSLCGDCRKCIAACPARALEGTRLDYTRCISYLTQKKENLSPQEQKLIHQSLYGCDICQRACLYNQNKAIDSCRDIETAMPRLSEFAGMTNRQFKEKYGKTAIGWRGLKIIKRNAGHIMYNLEEKGDN